MRISNRVLTIKDQQGAVLMDMGPGLILNLNFVGSIIWQQLRANYLSDEIANQLAIQFQIPYERASADVSKFLQQLESQRFLYP